MLHEFSLTTSKMLLRVLIKSNPMLLKVKCSVMPTLLFDISEVVCYAGVFGNL